MFDYVKYDEKRIAQSAKFKERVEVLADEIRSAVACPRSQALALTKLEEVFMWIGKGLRNDQIAENGSAELQEERKNG